jgi:Skp family chaperone for outer membrane proteins
MDPEQVKKILEEIERLNGNLENLHRDAGEIQGMRSDIRALVGALKDNYEKLKALPAVAKHLSIFNQILLQTRKAAGVTGMFSSMLDALSRFSSKGR